MKTKEEIKWQETLATVERERERERYNLTKKYVISQEGVFLNKNIPKWDIFVKLHMTYNDKYLQ